jgi:transposase
VDIPTTQEDVPMAEKRRNYTEEFKAEAVRLLKGGGERTLAQVARDIGVSETTLWGWAYRGKRARAKREPESKAKDALTLTERDELRQLRRENALLREEREILKKATAFFAKENK